LQAQAPQKNEEDNAGIIQQANLLYDFLQIELEKMRRRSIAQILCRQEHLRKKARKAEKEDPDKQEA
jgi:hypothetical protein